LLVLLASCGGGGDDDGGLGEGVGVQPIITNYEFSIVPEQVIEGAPAPASVSGSGSLQVSAGAELLISGTVTLTGIDVIAVTFHTGFAGEVGPALADLEQSDSSTWTLPTGADLDPEELTRLNNTGYYVRVTSAQGVLRGQILPEGWSVEMVELSGDAVVPPVATSASAKAGFAINMDTATYRVRITTTGLSDPLAANIREGFAGESGPVLEGLEQSASSADVWGSRDINIAGADNSLTTTGLELFKVGSVYLGIDTLANQDGELRGQVLPEGVEVHFVELTAEEVVVDGGGTVTSPGAAIALVTYRPDTGQMAVTVNTDLLDAVTIAVLQSPVGQNGPQLFVLTRDAVTPGNWGLPAVLLTTDQVDALNNQELYVAVFTALFPSGELRGQIVLGRTGPKLENLSIVFDESTVSSSEADESGGQLSLDVPLGASFQLSIPPQAFDETVEIEMQSILSIEGLPEGIVPIAAVRLGPSGNDFGFQPVLIVDSRSLPQGIGAIVGFLANDDGSELTFLPPVGPDPIAESAGDGPFSFDIPHFSIFGIAEVDPEGPGIPDADPGDSVEVQVKERITQRLAEEARRDQLGEDNVTTLPEIAEELAPWLVDLRKRIKAFQEGATLDQLIDIIKESMRYQKMESFLSSDTPTIFPLSPELEIAVRNQLIKLNEQCAIDQLLDWLKFLNRFKNVAISFEASQALQNLVRCYKLKLDPTSIVEFVPSAQTISATLVDENGNTIAYALDGSNFFWTLSGLVRSGNPLVFDFETTGSGSVKGELLASGESESTDLYGIPSFTGTWSASANGPVTCPDPEDNSFYDDFGMLTVSSQEITNKNPPEVKLDLTGGDEEITINSMSLTLTFSPLGGPGSVVADVTGSMAFTQTEVIFDEAGNPITHTTTGTLDLSGRFANGIFDLHGEGRDSDGCTFEGPVTLRR